LTLTYAKLGEQAFGTAPGEAECWMTIRSYEDEALHEMEDECVKSAKQIADRNGIAIELSRHEPFAATVNDAQATAMIEKAAEANSLKIIQLDTPFKWSEDFGQFGQCSPIALFGIGSGLKQPALHNPDFNFPDSLIDPAVDMFEHLCRQNNG
ncbi:MAG: amidohydrolase, partial [Bacteroidetes bacterium]|nr:amidohydrolase [Bacteroidota bacterium]